MDGQRGIFRVVPVELIRFFPVQLQNILAVTPGFSGSG